MGCFILVKSFSGNRKNGCTNCSTALAELWALYAQRYDYEEVEEDKALALLEHLRQHLPQAGTELLDFGQKKADDFTYHDPVDQSVSTRQGIRIFSRMVHVWWFVYREQGRVVRPYGFILNSMKEIHADTI